MRLPSGQTGMADTKDKLIESGGHEMTRRELREHCFKLLFCADFYPEGETKEQMEEYFTEPEEEVSAPGGESEILHSPALDVFDGGYVTNKVERIIEKIPDLDGQGGAYNPAPGSL